MAEDSYQERTEKPTPKRRARAREKGQVARSKDLSAALILLAGLGVLAAWVPTLGAASAEFMRAWLLDLRPGVVTPAHLPVLFMQCSLTMAKLLAPIWLTLGFTAILANYLQVGWLFVPGRLAPDWSRFKVLEGLKRLFSGNSLVELAKSLAKVAFIGLVVYFCFQGRLFSFLPLVRQDAWQFLARLQDAAYQLSGRIIVLFIVLGLLDYFYQRYRFEKSLRMTKQEIKDEMRQAEGDPRVKARLRTLMRQLAYRRMMAAVPQADVVVTNPTHLAVALRYDGDTMIAPQVVAKGRGFIALKIMAVADEAGVPRVENPELARSLFRLVEVGEAIPTSLYRAVAEVLAYIFSLRAAGGAR